MSQYLQTGTWVDEYVAWASKRSPLTPPHFHANIAVGLLAGAVAGRTYLQLPQESVRPNLYILVVATTSVYAKTTAFGIANEAINAAMRDRVISDISTPEALIYEMAGRKPENFDQLPEAEQQEWLAGKRHGPRRLMMLDEAGRFFNSLQRDYNATLDSLFMALYDASETKISRSTVKMGRITVNRPALSCLFATTPANARSLLRSRDSWASGFWGRWCFVTANQPLPWKKSEYGDVPKAVIEPLAMIGDGWLSKYEDGKAYNIDADPKVFNAYDEASKASREMIIESDDDYFHSVYSRLPSKHLKLAMLLSIVEANGKKPHIKLSHWNAAKEIVSGWQRDSLIAVEEANRTEQLSDEKKIMAIIESYAEGVNGRYLQQRTNKSSKEITDVLESLRRNGMAEPIKNGRILLWKAIDSSKRSVVGVEV